MSNNTLTIKFMVDYVKDLPEARFPEVRNFAAKLPENFSTIQQFVPELQSLVPTTTHGEPADGNPGEDCCAFTGELLVDQESTLGQYILTGRPTGEDKIWHGEEGDWVFNSIGIITDRIFCVPYYTEHTNGIFSKYKLKLDSVTVQDEGQPPQHYSFSNFMRNSGGSKGL